MFNHTTPIRVVIALFLMAMPLVSTAAESSGTVLITGLDASDNGKFYDFQGKELPW